MPALRYTSKLLGDIDDEPLAESSTPGPSPLGDWYGHMGVSSRDRPRTNSRSHGRRRMGSLYCKVSEKGAISIYGLQRMPVTLYVEQWGRLLDFADEIRAFMKEHDSELKRKEK
jgi:hypothetical protein